MECQGGLWTEELSTGGVHGGGRKDLPLTNSLLNNPNIWDIAIIQMVHFGVICLLYAAITTNTMANRETQLQHLHDDI